MLNFNYYVRTDLRFGEGQIRCLEELVDKYAFGDKKNVLLVYGGGSIKKNGIYESVIDNLKGKNVKEVSGVLPNPRISKIREGVNIAKEMKADVIVAIGGGSVIDSAKMIAAGYYYDNDPWDMVLDAKKIKEVLPIVAILTIAATGSEMNKNAVVTNEETGEKLGTSSKEFIPRAAICDPTYLYSLPASQTAAGTADIMSHTFEQYFRKNESAYLSNRIAEGVLKTCIHYLPIALSNPTDYEARANLMWASTVALNSLISCGMSGAWSCHPIEHELSAFYDVTHGVGLAIITPRWMRYVLNEETVDKFVEYAKNVFGITGDDKMSVANAGIDATEKFFLDCKIPMTLREIGIDDSKLREMAEACVAHNNLSSAFVPLDVNDIENILKDCL